MALAVPLSNVFHDRRYVVNLNNLGTQLTTADGSAESEAENSLDLATSNGGHVRCRLPGLDEDPAPTFTDSAITAAWKYIEALDGTCTRRIIGWWTYELCHAVRMRQFHEVRAGRFVHVSSDASVLDHGASHARLCALDAWFSNKPPRATCISRLS